MIVCFNGLSSSTDKNPYPLIRKIFLKDFLLKLSLRMLQSRLL